MDRGKKSSLWVLLGVAGVLAVAALLYLQGGPGGTPARATSKAGAEPDPPPAIDAVPTPAGDPASESTPVVQSGWQLVGSVVDRTGMPVAGAVVRAALAGRPYSRSNPSVRSDKDGNFVLDISSMRSDGFVRGYAFAERDGYQPGFASFLSRVRGFGNRPLRVSCVIALHPGEGVSGRIVDESGAAVPGASVALTTALDFRRRTLAVTGEDGRFVIAVPAAGEYRMIADAIDFRPHQSAPMDLDPERSEDIGEIRLQAGLTVEGTVRFSDGSPVPNASFWVLSAMYNRILSPSVSSDAQGGFIVRGLGAGNLKLRLNGWLGEQGAVEVECAAGDRDVELIVPGGSIDAVAVDASGNEVPGSKIRIHPYVDGNRFPRYRSYYFGQASHVCYAPFGRRILVRASASGHVPGEEVVELSPENVRTHLRIRLASLEDTVPVRVRWGATLPITLEFRTRSGMDVISNINLEGAQGPEAIVHVPPGNWNCIVRPPSGRISFLERSSVLADIVRGRDNALHVPLRTGGRLRITVHAPPNVMAGIKFEFKQQGTERLIPLDSFARGKSGWSAEFEAGKPYVARALLTPGHYQLRIEVPGHEPFAEAIRVDSHAFSDVVARMVRIAK